MPQSLVGPRHGHLRFATSGLWTCVLAAMAASLACQSPAPAPVPTKDSVFWTTPVDAPDDAAPSEIANQTEFFDHLPEFFQKRYGERLSPRIRVTDVRGKTRTDAEFARQVLGQRLFLSALSEFIIGSRAAAVSKSSFSNGRSSSEPSRI